MRAALAALNARTWASVRRHRNFRLFLAGQIVSFAGSWMQNIALAWFVVELTSSPVAVGLLIFARLAPFTLFGLFAGVVVDRVDHRRLLALTQVAQMAVSVGLAAAAFGGVDSLPLTYALAFAGGVGLVVESAARNVFTYRMVGPAELPGALALSVGLFNTAQVAGPAIAGIVIAVWGVGVCFVVNAASFVAVLAALVAMRDDELHPAPPGASTRVLAAIAEGFAFVRGAPEVRLVLFLVGVLSLLCVNFQALLPLLASETLAAGPEVLGVLSAVFGVGAATGALAGAALGRTSRRVLATALVVFGASLVALAPVRSLAGCAALLLVAGGAFTIWTSSANALIQLAAPDALRGRVVSLYLWAFGGVVPVGNAIAGWLVETGGTTLAFAVSGAAALAAAAVAGGGVRPCPAPNP